MLSDDAVEDGGAVWLETAYSLWSWRHPHSYNDRETRSHAATALHSLAVRIRNDEPNFVNYNFNGLKYCHCHYIGIIKQSPLPRLCLSVRDKLEK